MIKITSDSTGDLSEALLKEYDISTTPLGIILGGTLHKDGIDITTRGIKEHVDGGGDLPTTNAVNVGEYEVFFRELRKTYDGVIHFTIGSGFSSCYQNACIAAREIPNVVVIDSENLCVGQGMMALKAAEAARDGKSMEEIVALCRDMVKSMEMSFVVNRLDYLKKGGRCSAVAALGANLLKLHPCIDVEGNAMTVGKKYRGGMERVVREYIKERLQNRDDIDCRYVCLVDTNGPMDDSLTAVGRQALQEDGRFERILEVKAGCTIFSHVGEGTLGIAFFRK